MIGKKGQMGQFSCAFIFLYEGKKRNFLFRDHLFAYLVPLITRKLKTSQ